jgi:hypothetical protein
LEAEPGARPVELFEGRSSVVTTCPFFRSQAEGQLVAPIEAADPANRCIALDEPQPLSPRHQRLVCLTSDHVNCPRYLRGADMAQKAAAALPHRRSFTTAIFAAILVLIASSAASLAFVVTRGGLDIPIGGPTASTAAAVTRTEAAPVPTTAAVASVEPSPSPPPSPSVEPSAGPSPSPAPTHSPKPTPEPTRPRTPAPSPTSDRFAVLTRCPDRPDCWIYTVRAGDNLFSIAHWFGVPLDRIYEMNPWTRARGIHAGDELLIPTPTR